MSAPAPEEMKQWLEARLSKPWSSANIVPQMSAKFLRNLAISFPTIGRHYHIVYKARALLAILALPRPLDDTILTEIIGLLEVAITDNSVQKEWIHVLTGIVVSCTPEIQGETKEKLTNPLKTYLGNQTEVFIQCFKSACNGMTNEEIRSKIDALPAHQNELLLDLIRVISNGNCKYHGQGANSSVENDSLLLDESVMYKPAATEDKYQADGEVGSQALRAATDRFRNKMRSTLWTSRGEPVCNMDVLGENEKQILFGFFNKEQNGPEHNPHGPQADPLVRIGVEKTTAPTKNGGTQTYVVFVVLHYDGSRKWAKSRKRDKNGTLYLGLQPPSLPNNDTAVSKHDS